jgi:hypothetical protein
MSDEHPGTKNLTPWQPGESGNPDGRPKGTKNLASIVRELEEEQFDWSKFPKTSKKMKDLLETLYPMGSPLRAMVYVAVLDSISGKGIEKINAREWLRKAGYGDKLDVTSKGKRIKQEPIIVSEIKARHVDPQTETETDS